MFITASRFKSNTISALILGLGACDVSRPSSPWVRLPSTRSPDCTDSTWVCAGWKDQEFNRQTIYGRGESRFVSVRNVGDSSGQRLEVSCAHFVYRIDWRGSGAIGTLKGVDSTTWPWLELTAPWEQVLAREVCTKGL
jgi:hypothetical protein